MGLELLWLSNFFNNLIGKYQVVYHCTESICIQAKAASSRLPRHNSNSLFWKKTRNSISLFLYDIFLELSSCIKLSTECFIVFSWKHCGVLNALLEKNSTHCSRLCKKEERKLTSCVIARVGEEKLLKNLSIYFPPGHNWLKNILKVFFFFIFTRFLCNIHMIPFNT